MIPYFSIIIPSYNSKDTIERTILSALNNTWTDVEVLVIDDGSTDGSAQIVTDMLANDSRLRLLSQINSGPNKARNLGIYEARGRYLMFLDSDDLLEKTALEGLQDYLEPMHPDFACFGIEFVDKRMASVEKRCSNELQVLTGKQIFKESLVGHALLGVCWNKVINRDFLIENAIGFIEDRIHGRDTIFCRQLSFVAQSVLIIPRIYVSSLVRLTSYSRSFSPKNIDSALIIARDHEAIFLPNADRNDYCEEVNYAISKHLRYISILAAFRLDELNSYLKCIAIVKTEFPYMINKSQYDTFKDRVFISAIGMPLLLYFSCRILKLFSKEPY